MRRIRDSIKPSTVLLIAAAVVAVSLLPIYSTSIDWGASGGHWVRTSDAGEYDALCNTSDGWCREWCEGSPLVPTGQYCCTGPDEICNATDILIVP